MWRAANPSYEQLITYLIIPGLKIFWETSLSASIQSLGN